MAPQGVQSVGETRWVAEGWLNKGIASPAPVRFPSIWLFSMFVFSPFPSCVYLAIGLVLKRTGLGAFKRLDRLFLVGHQRKEEQSSFSRVTSGLNGKLSSFSKSRRPVLPETTHLGGGSQAPWKQSSKHWPPRI